MIPKDIKEKIFALYWGQEVFEYTSLNGEEFILPMDEDVMRLSQHPGILLLKPLSQITDEEAREVARRCDFSDIGTITRHPDGVEISVKKGDNAFGYRECIHIYSDGWVEYEDQELDNKQAVPVSIFDYLRSRGYALPAFGYSIEELVKEGVFKIKTNDQ